MGRFQKGKQQIKLERLQNLCADFISGNKGYGYGCFKRKVGLNDSTFSRVMYEGKDFSVELLVRISERTGVSVDWLLGLSDTKYLKR